MLYVMYWSQYKYYKVDSIVSRVASFIQILATKGQWIFKLNSVSSHIFQSFKLICYSDIV